MLVAIVQVHIKTDFIELFKTATLDNASNSIKEPGVFRFDVYQQSDDPTRFTLIEIYRSEDAPNKHRGTGHYARWRDTVSKMMAEPRTRITYSIVYPPSTEI
jgi:(4S)-4-hydroxy-5-phosphonooxypentane-2,3-dione isomerase